MLDLFSWCFYLFIYQSSYLFIYVTTEGGEGKEESKEFSPTLPSVRMCKKKKQTKPPKKIT